MIAFPTRPLLEVADILRAHGEAYCARYPVSPLQAAVIRRLVACRTAALGGHVDACGRCGYTRCRTTPAAIGTVPNARPANAPLGSMERLLPIGYFHVVFTLPALLYPLLLHNQRLHDRIRIHAARFKRPAPSL